MNPSEEQKGTVVPAGGGASAAGAGNPNAPTDPATAKQSVEPADSLDSYDDGYPHEPEPSAPASSVPVPSVPVSSPPISSAPPPARTAVATIPRRPGGGGKTPPPPPPPPSGGDGGGGDEDDDGMLRMSFLGHLEELRSRIIRSLMGVAVAFAVSLIYTNALWDFVCQPAVAALKALGYKEQNLVQIEPMEAFNVIWFKLPVLCAIFLFLFHRK